MGPTWIVVVTYTDGTTDVERFSDEVLARAEYDAACARENVREAYLATARSEMHR